MDRNTPKYTLKNQPNKQSLSQDRLKENLSSYLSSDPKRRGCSFEWFYSAIVYTWFAKKEFVEYLNRVGFGHIPRLSHVEWGVIRRNRLLRDIDCNQPRVYTPNGHLKNVTSPANMVANPNKGGCKL